MRPLITRLFPVLALVLFCAPRLSAQEVQKTHAKWEKDIAAFEAQDRANPPKEGGIVFVGSSSIRRWTTLQKDFPSHRVLNRGFGGSQMEDSLHFADRIVIPYAPRMIVVYAGSNDINAGKTPEQVFGAFREFVEKVRKKLPRTTIAYISIAGNPKRWAQVEQVKAANRLIEEYVRKDAGLKFINVFPRMLGADGLPLPDIFVEDRLHMNAKGYQLWTQIIGEYLPASDI